MENANNGNKEDAKLIIKSSGEVEVKGDFDPVIMIGLLEHELAYLRASIEERKRQEIKEVMKRQPQ